MKKILILVICFMAFTLTLKAQGPPITGDKPIMLGGGSYIVKTLTEIRKTTSGSVTRIPIMVHYLPSSNSLLAVHIPMVNVQYESGFSDNGMSLGDINVLGKYQFYRRDSKGKTFRMVAKTLQILPTGKKLGVRDIATGEYSGYYALVTGYETIKYGIANELGFDYKPSNGGLDVIYKFGVGLPLLEPVYPVNQLNLYFEPQVRWETSTGNHEFLYAQGIQYAIKRLTLEAALQFKVSGNTDFLSSYDKSIYLGTRYIF